MRGIKFRGQKEHTNEWVYGSVVLNQGLMSLIVPTGKTYYSSPLMIHEGTWVYTETISQFTNLKDKNGREIYEGDVESDENGNLSVVCYLEKYGAYCFVPVELYKYEDYAEKVNYEYGTDCYFHNAVPSKYSAVVGNIYENPELLEVAE